MAPPEMIKDFYVLPIMLPALPALPTTATHYMYLKPHEPKLPTPTSARSIFLANVPFDATSVHISSVLEHLTPAIGVDTVLFEGARSTSKPAVAPAKKSRKRKRAPKNLDEMDWPETWDRELHMPGGTAVVVLQEEKGVKTVVRAVKALASGKEAQKTWPVWGAGLECEPLGSSRTISLCFFKALKKVRVGSWLLMRETGYKAHSRLTYPSPATLKQHVNDYFTAYDAEERGREEAAAKARSEPDANGFVVVSRGGRLAPARQKDAEATRKKHEDRKEVLSDFYRWQVREERKEKERATLMEFVEAKKQIEELKSRNDRKAFQPEE
ncbi:MAG: Ribosomal RNA-processing protein 7 [Vezdaea aestivalis]|nr:MAG: Ribosomal RNA-processing protein 7 [Vezdaea aestivalis]